MTSSILWLVENPPPDSSSSKSNMMENVTPADNANPAAPSDIGAVEPDASVISNVDTSKNYPPAATDQQLETGRNTPIDVTLSATDQNKDTLIAAIESIPANGVLSDINQQNGIVTYTPNNDFTGKDSFSFKVNDGVTDSNIASVTILVTDNTQESVVPSEKAIIPEEVAPENLTAPIPYPEDQKPLPG